MAKHFFFEKILIFVLPLNCLQIPAQIDIQYTPPETPYFLIVPVLGHFEVGNFDQKMAFSALTSIFSQLSGDRETFKTSNEI